ncbi:hypothetical protein [Hungatella hathewayi]|uniref:hypothetical protein n=1 Tax=Hungatella hathewayi TaxID=154046 RepID=UPI00356344A8
MSLFYVEKQNIYCEGKVVAVAEPLSGFKYREDWEEKEEGVFYWTRTVYSEECDREDFETIHMALKLVEPVRFYMIPGVLYNGNSWGAGLEPKGLVHEGEPWVFASHRSGIPAGLYCQSEKTALGMWAEPSSDLTASCSFSEENGKMTARLLFPEQEGPVIYCARDTYEDCHYTDPYVNKSGIIRVSAVVVLKKRSSADGYDYDVYLQKAWEYFKRENQIIMDKQSVWNLGFSFIKDSAYFEEKGFAGFCMGLTWQSGGWRQKKDYLEIGWVGQHASLAVSLIYKALIDGESADLEKGLKVLDHWAHNAVLPNGLFRCRYDRILKYENETENREERQDAANLYSVIEEYLEAYHMLLNAGIDRSGYLTMVERLCDFITGVQSEDGRLGKAWYNDGTCSDQDGTAGCYLASGLCSAFTEFKKPEYMTAARRAFEFYYREFMECGYTTAGALDTCCVDKESAIPLLETAVRLYEIEGKRLDLERAVVVSRYLATWQYHYDVEFPDKSILRQLEYLTRGGTAVSVQHHHIDCYGLVFYEIWMKLTSLTGDPVWRERAEAIWNNSLYNISDGRMVINGQRRPQGAQDEGFLQTRWHTKKGDYFGVSEWLVVWHHAFRLKILRKEFFAKRVGYDKEEKNIW